MLEGVQGCSARRYFAFRDGIGMWNWCNVSWWLRNSSFLLLRAENCDLLVLTLSMGRTILESSLYSHSNTNWPISIFAKSQSCTELYRCRTSFRETPGTQSKYWILAISLLFLSLQKITFPRAKVCLLIPRAVPLLVQHETKACSSAG